MERLDGIYRKPKDKVILLREFAKKLEDEVRNRALNKALRALAPNPKPNIESGAEW